MAADSTTVQVRRAEHDGLIRVRAQMELDTGRRVSLAQVIAELLRTWTGQRQEAGR